MSRRTEKSLSRCCYISQSTKQLYCNHFQPGWTRNDISWIPRTQKTDNEKWGAGKADNSLPIYWTNQLFKKQKQLFTLSWHQKIKQTVYVWSGQSKWLKSCNPPVKIHNETCLLFSENIHATSHIIPSSHNLMPALKTQCWQMHLCLGIQDTIYLFFHYASLYSGKDKWTSNMFL